MKNLREMDDQILSYKDKPEIFSS